MTEIHLLCGCLGLALLLAPRMTNYFFLSGSTVYAEAHRLAFWSVLLGTSFGAPWATLAWPVFCALGPLLYLRKNAEAFPSPRFFVPGIPFAFSLISSVWLVAAAYDAHLLGYGREWSLYAALHGAFLGWILVGCFARLAQNRTENRVYLLACALSLPLFLSVALGIDGVPHLKRLGVIGFSLLAPITIGYFIATARRRAAAYWAALSLVAVCCSLGLALLNEFWLGFPRMTFGMPTMVVIHGILNALVAVPCFLAATHLDRVPTSAHEDIVFFDDVCVICNRSVHLLIHLDRRRRLRYSSLRGAYAASLAARYPLPDADSVAFWHGGKFYCRSEAVIRILFVLDGPFTLLALAMSLIPGFVMDALYDLIARYRYRIFGKYEACLVPTSEMRALFLP